ncbi:MAG: hypothetical protein ACJ8F7_05020 [Gemmataceae bacterium]
MKVKFTAAGQQFPVNYPNRVTFSARVPLIRIGEPVVGNRHFIGTIGRFDVDAIPSFIPRAVIELVPESLARENGVLPVGLEGDTLLLAMPEPVDLDLAMKLAFVLDCPVSPIAAPAREIAAAIDRYYRRPGR